MARTQAIKNYNDLLKGLITEGNEYNPPEGAFKDSLNVELVRTGGVKRRQGIRKEVGAGADGSDTYSSAFEESPSSVFDWDNAGGLPDYNFVCVKVGTLLKFYKKGITANLLDNFIGSVALSAKAGTTYNSITEDISVVNIHGLLCVVGRFIEPLIIQFTAPNVLTIRTTAAKIKIRDFDGDNWLVSSTQPVNYNRPANSMTFNTQTANFTVGATLTGATSGAQAIIAGQTDAGTTGTILTYPVFSAPSSFTNGEIITDSSGRSATIGTVTYNEGLTTHRWVVYNLMNQGWTAAHIQTYIGATGNYPSNAQVWHAGKDAATGVFTPALLDKVDFGNSPA